MVPAETGTREMLAGCNRRRSIARAVAFIPLVILALGLALAPAPAAGSPGWELILDRPRPEFGGIDFVSESEGWLVAGGGLLHTTDGGATWEESAPLSGIDVDFADAEHGWLVGYNGVIHGTSDGGQTWSQQASGTNVHLSEVVPISAQEAWAVGSGAGFSDVGYTLPLASAFLRTTDAGANWQPIETPPDSWFREIVFVGRRGWALGERCVPDQPDSRYCHESQTALLHTADGGDTWSLLETDLPGLVRNLVFADAEHGWVTTWACVGDRQCSRTVYRTEDRGLTWQQLDVGEFDFLAAMAFRDDQTGWVLALECENQSQCAQVLLSTEDGGRTWSPVGPVPQGRDQHAETLLATESALYVVGDNLALRSVDDGSTWQPMEHPALVLSEVEFVDRELGYAISSAGLLRTEDAGRNWQRMGPVPEGAVLLEFLDRELGFSAGEICCADPREPRIYRTADAGATWTSVFSSAASESGTYPITFQFVDRSHGWFAVGGGTVVTDDGGATWEEHALPSDIGPYLLDADLASRDEAWAIAAKSGDPMNDDPMSHLLHSRDGGRTWEIVARRSGEAIQWIDFVDAKHGWYKGVVCDAQDTSCRGVLLATEDGGGVWTEVGAGPGVGYFGVLLFVDRLNGWASGRPCRETGCTDQILHTADGGRTWTPQLQADLDGATLEFVDTKTGWLLRDPRRAVTCCPSPHRRMLLYHTTDGGGGPIGDIGATPASPKGFPISGTGAPEEGTEAFVVPALILAALGAALGTAAIGLRRPRGS